MRYSGPTRLLHWLLVPLLWGLFGFGKYLGNIEPSVSNVHLWGWHKSVGLSVFALIFIRVVWRLTHKPPRHVGVSPLQHHAAQTVHLLLYVLMVLTPLFGWIASSATGLPISIFGLVNVPLIGPEGEAAERLFFQLHGLSATALIILSIGHLAAALFHHFWRRNGLLGRMWL